MQYVVKLYVIVVFLLIGTISVNASDQIVYNKRWISNTPINVVTIDLNSPEIKVSIGIARNGIGTSEGFGSMLSRFQPAAAITGTYFCIRSLVPVGDIIVDGRLVNTGTVGTAVCFTEKNTVEFKKMQYNGTVDWTKYASVICTGPRLVTNSVAYVNPWAEGFRDKAHYRKARRSALGLTKYGKLLLVTVNRPIYLSKLAKIMKNLGAVDAVSLDGGTSTALYCKGRVPSHPGRRLTNLIVVYESLSKYAMIKDKLAPNSTIARTSLKS